MDATPSLFDVTKPWNEWRYSGLKELCVENRRLLPAVTELDALGSLQSGVEKELILRGILERTIAGSDDAVTYFADTTELLEDKKLLWCVTPELFVTDCR